MECEFAEHNKITVIENICIAVGGYFKSSVKNINYFNGTVNVGINSRYRTVVFMKFN